MTRETRGGRAGQSGQASSRGGLSARRPAPTTARARTAWADPPADGAYGDDAHGTAPTGARRTDTQTAVTPVTGTATAATPVTGTPAADTATSGYGDRGTGTAIPAGRGYDGAARSRLRRPPGAGRVRPRLARDYPGATIPGSGGNAGLVVTQDSGCRGRAVSRAPAGCRDPCGPAAPGAAYEGGDRAPGQKRQASGGGYDYPDASYPGNGYQPRTATGGRHPLAVTARAYRDSAYGRKRQPDSAPGRLRGARRSRRRSPRPGLRDGGHDACAAIATAAMARSPRPVARYTATLAVRPIPLPGLTRPAGRPIPLPGLTRSRGQTDPFARPDPARPGRRQVRRRHARPQRPSHRVSRRGQLR